MSIGEELSSVPSTTIIHLLYLQTQYNNVHYYTFLNLSIKLEFFFISQHYFTVFMELLPSNLLNTMSLSGPMETITTYYIILDTIKFLINFDSISMIIGPLSCIQFSFQHISLCSFASCTVILQFNHHS